MLIDSFNRVHDYLRISLTDNCNFRCTYCMPHEDIQFMPSHRLMQQDEIVAIAKTFVSLGVKKIRLTGGEPTIRKDFSAIVSSLSTLPIDITLTSNGTLLHQYIDLFKACNIGSVNISIDTLNPKKFFEITKRNQFDQVWKNIDLLLTENFSVKLNVVVMKGVNDEEVSAFVGLTKVLPVHVRFIEFMPFDKNDWNKDKVITTQQMLAGLSEEFEFVKLADAKHDTAKKYRLISGIGSFAFITTMSAPFCSDCNRMRLTADGKMKNCLFGKEELDILGAFRRGEAIVPIIEKSLLQKHAKMGGQFESTYEATDPLKIENRSMIKIGG
jgi:molybdenum cofactor biosynthesis protein A